MTRDEPEDGSRHSEGAPATRIANGSRSRGTEGVGCDAAPIVLLAELLCCTVAIGLECRTMSRVRTVRPYFLLISLLCWMQVLLAVESRMSISTLQTRLGVRTLILA